MIHEIILHRNNKSLHDLYSRAQSKFCFSQQIPTDATMPTYQLTKNKNWWNWYSVTDIAKPIQLLQFFA